MGTVSTGKRKSRAGISFQHWSSADDAVLSAAVALLNNKSKGKLTPARMDTVATQLMQKLPQRSGKGIATRIRYRYKAAPLAFCRILDAKAHAARKAKVKATTKTPTTVADMVEADNKNENWVTVAEACALTGYTNSGIELMARRGNLRRKQMGPKNRWHYDRTALMAMANRQNGARGPRPRKPQVPRTAGAENENWITCKEAAALSGYSVRTIEGGMIRRGLLQRKRLGPKNLWHYDKATLMSWATTHGRGRRGPYGPQGKPPTNGHARPPTPTPNGKGNASTRVMTQSLITKIKYWYDGVEIGTVSKDEAYQKIRDAVYELDS